MPAAKPITIVGGGLAGLALGIGLRRQQVPVAILEAGCYPRHRVCGEFVSGQGQETIARLGLMPLLERAGARPAQSAALYTPGAASGPRRLPAPAICISRYHMDRAFADEFTRLGGTLQVGARWRGSFAAEGLVGAAGRQRAASADAHHSWFGLKVHLGGVRLEADLELHLGPVGYIGLCRLEADEVNVCGLFKAPSPAESRGTGNYNLLLALAGPELRRRLQMASVDENSFCSVAGLNYQSRPAVDPQECLLGDCLTMTPPFTGNGMSMAFEAAEMAIEPLAQYSMGELDWREAIRQIRLACHRRFARRLAWARLFHRLILYPAAQRGLASLVFCCDSAWQMAFALTRQA